TDACRSACLGLVSAQPLWRCSLTSAARARRPPAANRDNLVTAEVVAPSRLEHPLRNIQGLLRARDHAILPHQCREKASPCRSAASLQRHKRGKRRLDVFLVSCEVRPDCVAAAHCSSPDRRCAGRKYVRGTSNPV